MLGKPEFWVGWILGSLLCGLLTVVLVAAIEVVL